MGALSLTGSKVVQRRGFAPLVPMVHHIDYPNAYRVAGHEASDAQAQAAATLETLNQLEDLFKRTVPADEVAAIIVEPIQGEGGYIVPPPQFHRELKAIAERHGILHIADEVQTGMGRTGKMFAMEHFGVTPDIVCLAKGIASGMPLGAMIARADIMDWGPGSHASTFGGNPISCVAALETIHVLQDGLMDSAATTGQYLMEALRTLQERHPLIGEVRGIGLMVGMELVRDRQTKEPAPAERERLVQEAFRRGLLLLGCGESTVRFCPPLVVTQAEVDTAVSILDDVLKGL